MGFLQLLGTMLLWEAGSRLVPSVLGYITGESSLEDLQKIATAAQTRNQEMAQRRLTTAEDIRQSTDRYVANRTAGLQQAQLSLMDPSQKDALAAAYDANQAAKTQAQPNVAPEIAAATVGGTVNPVLFDLLDTSPGTNMPPV